MIKEIGFVLVGRMVYLLLCISNYQKVVPINKSILSAHKVGETDWILIT